MLPVSLNNAYMYIRKMYVASSSAQDDRQEGSLAIEAMYCVASESYDGPRGDQVDEWMDGLMDGWMDNMSHTLQ